MVYATEKKSVIPWTKRTSYANIAASRRPSEVAQGTMAHIKNEDQDLNIKHDKMSRVHRKSLFQMDAQRRELERSMVEYTDKVREIRDSKTNSLFREIHTRQSRHSMSDTRSLTNSLESQDTVMIPVDSAKIRKRQKRLQMSNKSRFPPIIENNSRSEKKTPIIRPLSADRHTSDYKLAYRIERKHRRHRKMRTDVLHDDVETNQTDIEQFQHAIFNIKINASTNLKDKSTIGLKEMSRLKVSDTIETEYSGISSTDGQIEDNSVDLRSAVSVDKVQNEDEDEELFTLPKIHKRKQKLPLVKISNCN